MALTDMPTAAPEEVLLAADAPSSDVCDINDCLQALLGQHFPDVVVTGWDSVNVDIFHRDAPAKKIGGLLMVTADTLEPDGPRQRRVEIDDNHRPFPEEVIGRLGAPATAKEKALRDKAIFIRGEPRGEKLARVICTDACVRSYIY